MLGPDHCLNVDMRVASQWLPFINKDKTLKIKIPAGVEDNTRMRLSGEGEPGTRGGSNGDLYVFINVKPHKLYTRDGGNLYTRVPISMACAALGGTVEIPGIDGSTIEVKIVAGTQTDQLEKVRNEGMTILRSKHGKPFFPSKGSFGRIPRNQQGQQLPAGIQKLF